MKQTAVPQHPQHPVPDAALVLFAVLALLASSARADTDLPLRHDASPSGSYQGIVDLVVDPGFDAARVAITVDGNPLIEALRSPYRVSVDLGPRIIEHRITVTAWSANRNRVQWSETVNRGHQPLTVKVRAVDVPSGVFEAVTTSPDDDPITRVEVWDSGAVVASATALPYRFQLPAATTAKGFVQVTARTKSGEEVADFWSAGRDMHVDNVDVRTVPLYVSVIDRDGTTKDDVDRALFRVIDGNSEGKILQFGKASDQPISIALLLDASNSMTLSMPAAVRAATGFVDRTMKKGDRWSVYAVRDVPRRQLELSGEKAAVIDAVRTIQPAGETALYDAIDTAIRDLAGEKNRRAIVILTDGGDNDSLDSWDEVEKSAREAGIPIYFLEYENFEPTAQQDHDRMAYLATETGGFVSVATPETLEARYRDIERDLRAQFAIVYQVTDYAQHNEWRKVRVVMNSPKLTARTIGGYFAP